MSGSTASAATSSRRGSPRARAARIVDEVLSARLPADRLLGEAAVGLEGSDRSLLFELVLGSLRWLRRVDGILVRAAGRPLEKIEPTLRGPLRVAAYQLLFLDRVPSYAAVDEAVREVKRRGLHRASGFANAVLRRVAERRRLDEWPIEAKSVVERLGIEHSYPDFLIERWLHRFGEAAAVNALAAGNRPRPMHLLCFDDRREMAHRLREEGVETRETELSPLGLRVLSGDPISGALFREGRLYVQDDASQAAALLPPPRPGESIFDAAASPGGKGFAAAAFEPRVELVAADLSLRRVTLLRANERRLRTGTRCLVADARLPPLRPGFDRVVLDLPCSGTGTIARHPELKWRLSQREMRRLAGQGLEIVCAGAGLVRGGGLLCIITCSVEAEENEQVVARFLEERRDFYLSGLGGDLPAGMASGVVAPGLWRTLPSAEHDGFTVHVLRRAVGG